MLTLAAARETCSSLSFLLVSPVTSWTSFTLINLLAEGFITQHYTYSCLCLWLFSIFSLLKFPLIVPWFATSVKLEVRLNGFQLLICNQSVEQICNNKENQKRRTCVIYDDVNTVFFGTFPEMSYCIFHINFVSSPSENTALFVKVHSLWSDIRGELFKL